MFIVRAEGKAASHSEAVAYLNPNVPDPTVCAAGLLATSSPVSQERAQCGDPDSV